VCVIYVFFSKFVLQRHERNVEGRNKLVKKFAEEYQFPGTVCCVIVWSLFAFGYYFYICCNCYQIVFLVILWLMLSLQLLVNVEL